jgi:hypothetical protein
MIVFKIAKNNHNPWANKKRTGDFYSYVYLTLWENKNIKYKHAGISFGIRRSNKLQWILPWNTFHNRKRAIMFGVWKLYLEFFLQILIKPLTL